AGINTVFVCDQLPESRRMILQGHRTPRPGPQKRGGQHYGPIASNVEWLHPRETLRIGISRVVGYGLGIDWVAFSCWNVRHDDQPAPAHVDVFQESAPGVRAAD